MDAKTPERAAAKKVVAEWQATGAPLALLIAQALAAAKAEGVAEERARPYRTKDHPEANGRQPIAGEHAWTFTFPIEDGSTLTVHVGKKGRAALLNMANQEAADDVIDAALAPGDGGT